MSAVIPDPKAFRTERKKRLRLALRALNGTSKPGPGRLLTTILKLSRGDLVQQGWAYDDIGTPPATPVAATAYLKKIRVTVPTDSDALMKKATQEYLYRNRVQPRLDRHSARLKITEAGKAALAALEIELGSS